MCIRDRQKGVEASGLTWEGYKTTIRNGLLQKEVVRREVGTHVDISPDEVKQYYEAHPQEFTLPERVTLSEISVSTEGKGPEELASLRSKAEGLRTSVLNGDDFSQVARLYSQGSTAKDGGALGTFKKGELAPQIEAVVFQMNKGQISEVIQTRTGFEFLKVEDHFQAGLQPLDAVQTDIFNTVHAQKTPVSYTHLDVYKRQHEDRRTERPRGVSHLGNRQSLLAPRKPAQHDARGRQRRR